MNYKRIMHVPSSLFFKLGMKGIIRFIKDDTYLKIMYRCVFHKKLDLQNPKTFNAKLQWLKLYDHNPLYTRMVDKCEAKNYVQAIIGERYIIPTIGVWDHFDDIDFSKLPNQFVLKCTHDSGGLIICRDKKNFDKEKSKKKIEKCLNNNYYWSGREWPYKDVKPRIIAERYLEDIKSHELRDYKFFCFNGKVRFLYISEGLEDHSTARISYVSLDWKQLNFKREDFKPFEDLPPKPANLEMMIQLAETLSKDIPHLRVDFYDVNGSIYFGELTFFSGSGFTKFVPHKADLEIGNYLKLPLKKKPN